MKELTVREILERKAKLKEDIEKLIFEFTADTGVGIAAINLDAYFKRDMEGNLLQSNINVGIAVQI